MQTSDPNLYSPWWIGMSRSGDRTGTLSNSPGALLLGQESGCGKDFAASRRQIGVDGPEHPRQAVGIRRFRMAALEFSVAAPIKTHMLTAPAK
jgi:hypothetical protein